MSLPLLNSVEWFPLPLFPSGLSGSFSSSTMGFDRSLPGPELETQTRDTRGSTLSKKIGQLMNWAGAGSSARAVAQRGDLMDKVIDSCACVREDCVQHVDKHERVCVYTHTCTFKIHRQANLPLTRSQSTLRINTTGPEGGLIGSPEILAVVLWACEHIRAYMCECRCKHALMSSS